MRKVLLVWLFAVPVWWHKTQAALSYRSSPEVIALCGEGEGGGQGEPVVIDLNCDARMERLGNEKWFRTCSEGAVFFVIY